MQGPTVSPVFCKRDGKVAADYFAIVICVPKKALYKSVQQLRMVRINSLDSISICLCSCMCKLLAMVLNRTIINLIETIRLGVGLCLLTNHLQSLLIVFWHQYLVLMFTSIF